ncbi:MAG: hypothetical protein V3T28_04205 [Gemmatimonadales bacterium]
MGPGQHPGEQLAKARQTIGGVLDPDPDELNLEIRRGAPHGNTVPQAENAETIEPTQIELCGAGAGPLGRVQQDVGA